MIRCSPSSAVASSSHPLRSSPASVVPTRPLLEETNPLHNMALHESAGTCGGEQLVCGVWPYALVNATGLVRLAGRPSRQTTLPKVTPTERIRWPSESVAGVPALPVSGAMSKGSHGRRQRIDRAHRSCLRFPRSTITGTAYAQRVTSLVIHVRPSSSAGISSRRAAVSLTGWAPEADGDASGTSQSVQAW